MKTYKDTLDFLFSQLPMFQKIGEAAYKKDVGNIKALCEILKNPQESLSFIHIAGTNGKGSSSHMIASVLQAQGYRVGLYTSPHLNDFRERIKINGEMISENEVVQFVEKYQNSFSSISPSFFEWTVALAFYYFNTQKVDYVVLETGLGGRLDSTNVVTPLISTITNIGLDHQNILGNTISEIAFEKAGIIKKSIPIIIGEYTEETRFVFEKKAEEEFAPIYFSQDNYDIVNQKIIVKDKKLAQEIEVWNHTKSQQEIYQLDLLGKYQSKNLICCLQTIEVLREQGVNIEQKHIKIGLENVVENTRLQGRWQILNQEPITIADVGHNYHGLVENMSQLNQYDVNKIHIVIGFSADKSLDEILQLFPKKAIYYFCKAQNPRSMDEQKLQQKAMDFGLKGKSFKSVIDAYSEARKNAAKNDLIYIGGSVFVVAEVL